MACAPFNRIQKQSSIWNSVFLSYLMGHRGQPCNVGILNLNFLHHRKTRQSWKAEKKVQTWLIFTFDLNFRRYGEGRQMFLELLQRKIILVKKCEKTQNCNKMIKKRIKFNTRIRNSFSVHSFHCYQNPKGLIILLIILLILVLIILLKAFTIKGFLELNVTFPGLEAVSSNAFQMTFRNYWNV